MMDARVPLFANRPMSRFTTFARARLAVPVVALTVVALTVAACSPPIDSTVSVPGTSPRTPPVRVNVPAVSATELDTMIQRVVREKHMVGLSVGVMQNGAMILAKGYGQRVLSPSEPVTPTSSTLSSDGAGAPAAVHRIKRPRTSLSKNGDEDHRVITSRRSAIVESAAR